MLIVRNIRVIDPDSGMDRVADLVIHRGKIETVAMPGTPIDMPADEPVQLIEGSGLIAGPGLVDVHVHFRDPGQTWKEDILTGAKAAAAGGYTSVICMANTSPVIDQPETLSYVLEKGRTTGIHVLGCSTLTRGMKGRELVDMERMAAAGAAGFTDDGLPVMDTGLFREGLLRAAALDLPVSLHEEDPAFIREHGIHHGPVAERLGYFGAEAVAEYGMTARDLAIAWETGAVVDVQHVSSRRTVELIRRAKAAGIQVHAEATPHHFTLTDEAVEKYGTLAKMNPPLREEEDRRAIVEGLLDGTLDLIATDHAPHSTEEKDRAFTEAPSGIIGLETALGLAVRELVHRPVGRRMPWQTLFTRMSTAPAALYHLEGGCIREGAPADLVLLDENRERMVTGFHSKASNSPFLGQTIPMPVCFTICAGEIVYQADDAADRLR